jgi:L-rhamnose mutarotase
MARLQAFTLDLRDDPHLIAQYRAWHQPGALPPAIPAGLIATGITEMEIFLSGNRLVMILLTSDEFSAEAFAELTASNAEFQAWETLMWKFQQALPQQALPWAQPGEKWVAMDRIFALSEQS